MQGSGLSPGCEIVGTQSTTILACRAQLDLTNEDDTCPIEDKRGYDVYDGTSMTSVADLNDLAMS